ncbi:MAG: helix-turn-helix domain-containing protein [Planctomycetota bacterium]
MDPVDICWRLAGHGHDHHGPADLGQYWWENHQRGPQSGHTVLFQYTLAGSMTLVHGGRNLRVPQGHVALICYPEESAYGLTAEDSLPYECHWVLLHGAGLREHWQLLRHRYGYAPGPLPSSAAMAAMADVEQRASPRAERDPFIAAVAAQQFVARVHELLAQAGVDQRQVDLAIDRLVANPQYPWSLKELATEAGCSREHLSRAFTDRFGCGPAHWLQHQRLQRAKELLRGTSLPVAAVAEQSGFGSAHTLARVLRRDTGCSPNTFRR